MPSIATISALVILYFSPVLGVISDWVSAILPTPKIARPIPQGLRLRMAQLEYAIGVYRDVVALPIGLVLTLASASSNEPHIVGISLFMGSMLSTIRRRMGNRRALRLLLSTPEIHPQDFFQLLALYRSAWPPRGASIVRSLPPETMDFRDGKARQGSALRLFMSFHHTATLAWLALEGFRVSKYFGNQVFDPITRLWTTRLAANHKLRLNVTGLEELKKIKHNAIIALNHESVLDFALAFFFLGAVKTARGERLRVRFLAAKDHFVDNPILYSIMGIGRAMQQGGMVFVDRKRRGEGAKSIAQAVEVIQKHDVDVAIFPQGTRAEAHFDAQEEPYGAGYYTTTKGPIAGIGFFRSGAGRIAAHLAASQPVDVVCVGLVGVGRVMPARTFRTYKNREVHFTILPPIHIPAGTDLDADEISNRIELRLRKATGVHQRLLEVWQEVTGSTDEERQSLGESMAHWETHKDPAGYALLDAILTQSPAVRSTFLEEFRQLHQANFPAEPLLELRQRVGKERR